MRLTDAGLYGSYAQRFAKINEDLTRALRQLADHKRVVRSSDDPVGARSALELRARAVRIEGFDRAADTARFDLQSIETVLGSFFDATIEARDFALQGGSTINENNNDAIADEVDALRERLLGLANTSQRGRYLFGGNRTLDPPFDTATGAYLGNDNEVQLPIDSAQLVGVTLSGREAFLAGDDVFQLFEDLSVALRARDTAQVAALVPGLERKLDQLAQVRGQVGLRIQSVTRTSLAHDDELDRLIERISAIEDVSLERVALELSAANTSYQALASTASQVLGRSLFDYLG